MSTRMANWGRAVALAASLALAGCALGPSKEDPFEPANRVMFEVHEAVDAAVMRPLIDAYVANVPKLIRTGISNFFNNIDDLFSALNSALQGKFDQAGEQFSRVMLNTFVMGGIFDIASDVGLPRAHEDFGTTFGVWGFPQGPYLFVPIVGPTTVRDGTGMLVRLYIGPVGYIPDVATRNILYGIGAVDLRAQSADALSIADTASLDKYRFIRNAYLQRRAYLVNGGKPPKETEEE